MESFATTVARRSLTVLLIVLGAGVAAWAQTPDLDAIEADVKRRDARTQQISDQLDAGSVPEASLDSLLQTLLRYQDELRSDSRALTAALEEPTQRLDDLGPPPTEGQPPESADIARLREGLTDQVTRLTGLSKQIELSRAGVERLMGRVNGARAAQARASLVRRSVSPFSPRLWADAAAEIAAALDRLSRHAADWRQEQRARGSWVANLALLAAALTGAVLLLTFPRWLHWRRFEARLDDDVSPSAVTRRRRAAERTMSRGLLAAGAGAMLYWAGVETGLTSLTGSSLALRLWLGGVVLVVAWHFGRGVFSPRQPDWRIAAVSSRSARALQALFVAIFGLFVVDRVLSAAFALGDARHPLVLAQAALASTLFAVLLWLLLAPKLWQAEPESDGGAGPSKAGAVPRGDALRSSGRLLALLLLVANALSYTRLASFVFHRVMLLALFLIFLWSVRVLAVWGLSRLPAAERIGTAAPRPGAASADKPLDSWLNVALQLAILALSVPVLLLIVGFDWMDQRRWFGMLGADIRIGAVSVSFVDILSAVVVLLIVSMGTKWVTVGVDKRLSRHTSLDAGERDSIMTLVNYAGVVVGILIALSIVGVGLSRIAIVAGALSVGIGFGLQSIVSNFVSGLILLFERPIKMGDWVVVGSGEGYVKHIGARATEVQTFDRASILIPNSELVSSAVQNWFYEGRLGRMRLPVGVSSGSDPEQVRDILLDCARRHPGVALHPEPYVIWLDFGESSLDFELRCYAANYDDAYLIVSDLRFEIFRAFKDAGVEVPFPQRDLHIRSGESNIAGVVGTEVAT